VIPLDSSPNQSFELSLPFFTGNKNLEFNVRFNEVANYWTLSLKDVETGIWLISSFPLVTGAYPAGNILGQQSYLGLGKAYVVPLGSAQLDFPDDETLGVDFLLVWEV
jgi:hypothetical protein